MLIASAVGGKGCSTLQTGHGLVGNAGLGSEQHMKMTRQDAVCVDVARQSHGRVPQGADEIAGLLSISQPRFAVCRAIHDVAPAGLRGSLQLRTHG